MRQELSSKNRTDSNVKHLGLPHYNLSCLKHTYVATERHDFKRIYFSFFRVFR